MGTDIRTEILHKPVKHFNMTEHDTRPLVSAYRDMSFSARELAHACDVFNQMLADPDCTIILTIAGSTSAAGCMQIYADMIRYNMVDAIVATGATVVDMDFFEALGFSHFHGSQFADDGVLRELYIDRIYDTFIDEHQLQKCDLTIKEIADSLPARGYSSREFISHMGRWLSTNPERAKKSASLVQLAYTHNVPVFCPAFSDSSAGLGLLAHQAERKDAHVMIDSVRDFRELTELKMHGQQSGLFMIGGGTPKNFAQDTVIGAEILGHEAPMHKYSIQITVADVRDGACSSSTLKEAGSWGKVDVAGEQMVFGEASMVLPIIASHAYHSGEWQNRVRRDLNTIFNTPKAA